VDTRYHLEQESSDTPFDIFAQRDTELFLKIVDDAVVRQQLILRQIHRVYFDGSAVLDGAAHLGRKFRHKALTGFVGQYLSPVPSHPQTDVNIHHLPGFEAIVPLVTSRQGATIYAEVLNLIGIIKRFQRLAVMAGLATGFPAAVGT